MYDTLLEILDNMKVQYTIKQSVALLHAIGHLEHCIQDLREIDFEHAYGELMAIYNSTKKDIDLANQPLLSKKSQLDTKLAEIGSIMTVTPEIEKASKEKVDWTIDDDQSFKEYGDKITKLHNELTNKAKVI
jgi:hypothetical protein